ncbi:MAG: hypothetical protein QXG00_04720, partial [Candidatus Woesearchaeota archaeon]
IRPDNQIKLEIIQLNVERQTLFNNWSLTLLNLESNGTASILFSKINIAPPIFFTKNFVIGSGMRHIDTFNPDELLLFYTDYYYSSIPEKRIIVLRID